MKRIISFIALAVAAAGTFLVAAPAGAAPGGGLCNVDGNATLTPGLTNTETSFTYTLTGTVSGCQSNQAGAPAGGTIAVGQVVTVGASSYQAPVATGNGSCASSTTNGIATVTWADTTVTVVKYDTSGAAAAVSLQGTVEPSVTLIKISGPPTDPPSITITTTRYAGNSAAGALVFHPADPTLCTTGGVTDAPITGSVGIGSQS